MTDPDSPMGRLKKRHQNKRWALRKKLKAFGYDDAYIEARLDDMQRKQQKDRDRARSKVT